MNRRIAIKALLALPWAPQILQTIETNSTFLSINPNAANRFIIYCGGDTWNREEK